MKSSTLFGVIGLVLLIVGVSAGVLGLPLAFRAPALAAPPCLVIWASLRRRDKVRASATPATDVATTVDRQRPRPLVIVLVVLVSLSSAWWLQYTTHLSLPERIVSAVITCITCVAVCFIAAAAKPPKV